MFAISLIGSAFFVSELIFSIITKECFAKGVRISKEQYPGLYFVVLIVILALFIVSVAGMFLFK